MSSISSLSNGTDVLLAGQSDWIEALAERLDTRTEASVRTVTTAPVALETYRDRPLDCLVTGYDLDDAMGLELLRSIRNETDMLPVILCTAQGSEALASDAIAADVSDYVSLDAPQTKTSTTTSSAGSNST